MIVSVTTIHKGPLNVDVGKYESPYDIIFKILKKVSCVPYRSTTTSASDSMTVTSGDCSSINYLEHVVADITFSYTTFRGITELYLVSPSGTKSHLLHYRNQDALDNQAAGSLTWDFMSVHFWKENPIGIWTLEISAKSAIATGNTIQF